MKDFLKSLGGLFVLPFVLGLAVLSLTHLDLPPVKYPWEVLLQVVGAGYMVYLALFAILMVVVMPIAAFGYAEEGGLYAEYSWRRALFTALILCAPGVAAIVLPLPGWLSRAIGVGYDVWLGLGLAAILPDR